VIVNDEYFGKVPADRLVLREGVIYFRADGKKRSKIGIPWNRAEKLAGSYDADLGILTLIWCSIPGQEADYVNSNWGEQEDPWSGDVINSYNDGPTEDGTLLGPFYELESSSPALELLAGESASHVQRTMHFMGEEELISNLVMDLFGLELEEIKQVFQAD
jgi:hypothetical protein